MPSKMPYSDGVVPNKVDLPEELIKFYKKRSIYLEKLPSYEHIEGRGVIDPDTDGAINAFGFPVSPTWPLKYRSDNLEERTKRRSERLILDLYKANGIGSGISPKDVVVKERNYMLHARTRPIQIKADIEGVEKTFYVKKPNLARIFGNALYNVVSGHEENVFVFNDSVFISSETKGDLPTDRNRHRLWNSPRFKENIVRANVTDWFLCINDLDNLRNFVIDYNAGVKIIDFDCLFFRREDEDGGEEKTLVDYMEEEGLDFGPVNVKGIVSDEKREIRSRITRNEKHFEKLVSLMKKIPFFNEQAEKYFNAEDIEDYFDNRIEQLHG